MNTMSPTSSARATDARSRSLARTLCADALAVASAVPQFGERPRRRRRPATDAGDVTATLEQCVTSVVQAERSATFTGEMTADRGRHEDGDAHRRRGARCRAKMNFHAVSAPGLGVWRAADPKVKVYKYLKQVSNLSCAGVLPRLRALSLD